MHRTSQMKLQMRTAPIARGRPNLEHSTLSSYKYPQLLRVCQVTEGLSLHFPSTDHLLIVPYAPGRWTPAGFEPALATWTECCAPITPWALRPSSASGTIRKDHAHKLQTAGPEWESSGCAQDQYSFPHYRPQGLARRSQHQPRCPSSNPHQIR